MAFSHEPAFARLFRTFNKNPLRLMTCELLLKSSLDEFATQDEVLKPLRDVIYRLSDATNTPIPATAQERSLDFSGPMQSLGSEKTVQIMEQLNALFETALKPGVDVQMVAYEIRGTENIAQALDQVEANEPELESLYKSAKWKTVLPSGLYTASFYANWSTINFFVLPALALHDPGLALLAAAGFNAILSPVYYLRAIYQKKRVDSSFAYFKYFLRSMIAEPRPEQFAITSASLTVPSGFHKHVFSDQDPSDGAVARAQAMNLWGGSFIRFAAEWPAKGTDIATQFKRTVLDAGDRSRVVYVDRIAYFDVERNEPVWLFIYRAYRKTPAGRKPSPPKPSAESELATDPSLLPAGVR